MTTRRLLEVEAPPEGLAAATVPETRAAASRPTPRALRVVRPRRALRVVWGIWVLHEVEAPVRVVISTVRFARGHGDGLFGWQERLKAGEGLRATGADCTPGGRRDAPGHGTGPQGGVGRHQSCSVGLDARVSDVAG